MKRKPRVESNEGAARRAGPRAGSVERLAQRGKTGAATVPALAALEIGSFDPESRAITLRVGSQSVPARSDAALEIAVIRTAHARGERVIAQQDDNGWVVLGALRTTATPGVDEGDDYRIAARRIEIVGAHEVVLRAGVSSVVLRAYGFVETLAQDITTRAARVHKLVGRVLNLN